MRRSRLYGTLLCLLFPKVLCLAQEMFHTSPIQIQTANIYATSAIEESIDAFNPSVISEISTFGAQVSCSIPYSLKELRQVDAKFAASTPVCHVQGEVFKAGDDISSFITIGGGISRRFHKFGMGMEYRVLSHRQMDGATYKSSFSRVGMHVCLNEEWTVAMAVQNIEGRKLKYKFLEIDIPSFVVMGMKWHRSVFVLQAEVEKNWQQDAIIKVASTIKSEKAVFGSVGLCVRQGVAQPSVGVGAQTKHFLVDASMSYHNQLGVSSGAMLALINLW